MSRHDSGWVKSYRTEFIDFQGDVRAFAVYSFLLHFANHTESSVVFNGVETTLFPGDLITSSEEIGAFWNIHRNTVLRILNRLQNEGKITLKKSSVRRRGTLISVTNWSEKPCNFDMEKWCNETENIKGEWCNHEKLNIASSNQNDEQKINDNSSTENLRTDGGNENQKKWCSNKEEVQRIKKYVLKNKTQSSFKTTLKRSKYDLDSLYKAYPKRQNQRKAEALKKLSKIIQSDKDYNAFLSAIKKYTEYCEKQKFIGTAFIKQFATFVSQWEEWLEPESSEQKTKTVQGFDFETGQWVDVEVKA